MKDINKLIAKYLEDLEVRKKRSPRTVRNYELYLRRFSDWLREHGVTEVDQIKVEHIKKYRTYLKKIKNPIKKIHLKPNTQSYHLIAVREFLEYLNGKKIYVLQKKKVKLDKLIKRKSQCLTENEMLLLLGAPKKNQQAKLLMFRDLAILEILFSTGARVSEVAEIKLEDIDIKNFELKLGKKNKSERNLVMSNQTKYFILEYLKLRNDDSVFLFIGHDKANVKREDINLSHRSIERVLVKYGKLAGLSKKITPQVLRNTYLKKHINTSSNLDQLKDLLGIRSNNPFLKF